MIQDRQQGVPVQLIAQCAAGNLCLAHVERDHVVIVFLDLLYPHRGAGRHQCRLQFGQACRLPPDQGGADVRGHPAPIRAAQAPRRAEHLEARPCHRLVIARRREAEMAAEADMHLIAAVLQIGQSERPARECCGHQHHVQVIAGRVAVPEGQPGDAPRRQAQPADRHPRHLGPGRAVRGYPLGQRERHVEDVLRMARRARHPLRVMQRRAEAKPGDGAADRLGRADGAGLVGLGQVAQHRRDGVVESQVRPQSSPLRFRSRRIRRIKAAPSETRRARSPPAASPPACVACAMSFSARPS